MTEYSNIEELAAITNTSIAETQNLLDTALTAAKEGAEPEKKKRLNRAGRRKQEQLLRRIEKHYDPEIMNKTITERFQELPEQQQLAMYHQLLERVRQENQKFEEMEKEENDFDKGNPSLSSGD